MNDFWSWWQHLPENLSPVMFQIGWFKIQYYGLMYLVAFAVVYGLVSHRLKYEKRFSLTQEQVKDLLFNMIIGLIIGARLGYVVFYNPVYYLRHPLEIVLPFSFANGVIFTGISGMSFHGGLIGLLIAAGWTVKNGGMKFKEAADLFAPAVPLGYTFGRVGNFINGELYGRVTASPLGMYFPQAPGDAMRHPSQLYEAFFEGVCLFVVMWILRRRNLPEGAMLAVFLIGYGTVRFFIEYFRQPDEHIGFIWRYFSMGQILCGGMVAAGIFLFLRYRRDALSH